MCMFYTMIKHIFLLFRPIKLFKWPAINHKNKIIGSIWSAYINATLNRQTDGRTDIALKIPSQVCMHGAVKSCHTKMIILMETKVKIMQRNILDLNSFFLKTLKVNHKLQEYAVRFTGSDIQGGSIKTWHYFCPYFRQLLIDFSNFLLTHFVYNLQSRYYYMSHHAINVFLHYLVKYEWNMIT